MHIDTLHRRIRRKLHASGHFICQALANHTDTDKGDGLNPVTTRSATRHVPRPSHEGKTKTLEGRQAPVKVAVRTSGELNKHDVSKSSTIRERRREDWLSAQRSVPSILPEKEPSTRVFFCGFLNCISPNLADHLHPASKRRYVSAQGKAAEQRRHQQYTFSEQGPLTTEAREREWRGGCNVSVLKS